MILPLYFVLFLSSWIGAEACDGYTFHVRQFDNCDDRSIMKLHNFNVSLTPDCVVIPSGCLDNTKEIHSATVSYKVIRNMAPITGTKDGCKSLSSAGEEAFSILELFALPTSCPIKKGKVCNDKHKSVDVSKYRMKLPLLLGDIQATVKIDSDAGQSCLQFKGSLTKKIIPKLPLLG